MKQALKLSLAISLALGAGQVFAIGLGQIQVKSRLNQPLDAEIPVIVDRRGEAESLVVKLASAEEFSRVGIERSQIGVPLEFALGQSARGETVIKVTSKEAVRAPFLDFLLEANWSNGRVLREYTVLLDPPLTTPASAPSAVAAEPVQRPAVAAPAPPPVAAPAPAPVAKAEPAAPPDARPAPPAPVAPAPAPAPTPAPVAKAEPAVPPAGVAAPAAKPTVAAAPAKPAVKALPPSVAASNGSNYGPVAEGETLWEIAQATLPEDGVSANQLMLALLKANPDAFVRNNINQLKRGAILRIPSGEEIRAVGSMRAAAAQVQAQIAEWRGDSVRPTLLAGNAAAATAAAGKSESSAPRRGDDRLALVPPEMGKDGLASTGQAGSSAGAAGGNASAAELARANESLATQTREAGELRTRVKDLEGLQSKNERLISLKDSEIADLQRKLAEAQKAAPTVAATAAANVQPAAAAASEKPATPPAATTPATDDIWGKTTPVPAEPVTAATPVTPADTAASTGQTASSASSATPATPATTGSAAAVVPDPAAATGSAPSTPPAATVGTEPAPAAAATTNPVAAAPVAAVETAPLATPPAPTAVVPAEEMPWYLDPRILGGAGILALLAGFLALRSRRKPAVARPSLADQFAAGGAAAIPVVPQAGDGAILNDEETQLRDQITFKPDDLGARLELLSIYYADNRVDEFRDGAAEMQRYVDNPREPEWVQVRAMGEDLLPNDPLFAAATSDSLRGATVESARWEEETAPIVADGIDELRWDEDAITQAPTGSSAPVVGFDDQRYAPVRAADPLPKSRESDFRDVEAELASLDHKPLDDGLELSFDDDFVDELDVAPEPVNPTPAVAAARPLTEFAPEKKEESFGFDLPPLDFDMEFSKPATAATPAPVVSTLDEGLESDDEFFVGEDALGTKLDLARAYADMGDPDGARAMLEEVIAEGDSAQQELARKLLSELG